MFNSDTLSYVSSYSRKENLKDYGDSFLSNANDDSHLKQPNKVSGPNRSSLGKSKANYPMLESPYKSLTISMTKLICDTSFSKNQNKSMDGGPVILVGWPIFLKNSNTSPPEITFEVIFLNNYIYNLMKLADGTGSINVRIDVQSDKENWLINKINLYLFGSETGLEDINSEQSKYQSSISYLRIVGTLSYDMDSISLRCIHVRKATVEEVAYHHTLETIWCHLKSSIPNDAIHSAETPSTAYETNSECFYGNHCLINNLLTCSIDDSNLPEIFSLCKDPCQQAILRYIHRNRIPEKGVNKFSLYQGLSKEGYLDKSIIDSSIQRLISMTFCMETLKDYVDLVIDDDY